MRQFCNDNGIRMDVTDDAESFTEDNLQKYVAIVFLNTAGNIFNELQERAFESFIHAGGGFVGIHTAIDTEHSWDWYGKLIGAQFESRSEIKKAVLRIENRNHPATQVQETSLALTDEWFNLKDISPDIQILLRLDENTYDSGIMGNFHPVSWHHEFEGGRVFVTAMGHTKELYNDPFFLKHLFGGVKYVMGDNKLPDYKKKFVRQYIPQKTNSTGFAKTSMICDLYEPMELDMFPGGKIIFIERRGTIKLYDPLSENTAIAGKLDVYTKQEEGLLGIAIDPMWEQNHWIYLYYTPQKDNKAIRLSRFVFMNDSLYPSTENVLLKVPVLRGEGLLHAAGSIEFDDQGFLYIATGDNTSNRDVSSGGNSSNKYAYSVIDERSGREIFDAQKSSSNSMDLRGKILRIRPLADGSYLCPKGNLYVNHDVVVTVDSNKEPNDPGLLEKIKGTLHFAAIQNDKLLNGSNHIRPQSNNNGSATPHDDSVYSSSGRPEIFVMGVRNPFRISFDDRRHTLYWGDVGPDAGFFDNQRGPEGYDEINAAQTAGYYGWPYFIGPNKAYRDYDYKTQKAGAYFDPPHPINNSPNNTGAKYLPPARSSLIWYPFSSSKEFPIVANGTRCAMAGPAYYCDKYPEATRFPDRYNGNLIIYDWMRNWIMAVTLDSFGNYIRMERLFENLSLNRPIDMLFDKNGSLWILEYGLEWYSKNKDACLSRIDFVKEKERTPIQNGTNNTTTLKWNFFNRNRSFYQSGDILPYKLHYSDTESERLVSVKTIIEYKESTQNTWRIAQEYFGSAKRQNEFSQGQILIDNSDCKSCHALDRNVNGPAYLDISSRYSQEESAMGMLTKKILKGGSGNWGDRAMIAHPQLDSNDVSEMVRWILSLQKQSKKRIPREGRYTFAVPESSTNNGGVFVFHSTIKGGLGETHIFRSNLQQVEKADSSSGNFKNYTKVIDGTASVFCELKNRDFFKFKEIDLTGIKSLEFQFETDAQKNQTGDGILELRLDEIQGPVLGSIAIPASSLQKNAEIKKMILTVEQSALSGDNLHHDLIFLVKNQKAGSKPVVGMNWVRFNLE